MSDMGHIDLSHVWRLSSLLKRPYPSPQVGREPKMKISFPLIDRNWNRFRKSCLCSSGCWCEMSLVPAWITILVTRTVKCKETREFKCHISDFSSPETVGHSPPSSNLSDDRVTDDHGRWWLPCRGHWRSCSPVTDWGAVLPAYGEGASDWWGGWVGPGGRSWEEDHEVHLLTTESH